MTVTKPGAPAVELIADELAALLVDVKGVARICDCSTPHVRRLADAGRMPPPLRLGGLLRWRKTDIESWIAAGCPSCRNRGAR